MRSLVRPGVRNIKSQSTVQTQKGLVKRRTVQAEKQDNQERKQKARV